MVDLNRTDGSLLNLRRLLNTMTLDPDVRELLFADGFTLAVHIEATLRHLKSCFME
ncbi:hypothetical protein LOAG_18689, partial [Loa loa]